MTDFLSKHLAHPSESRPLQTCIWTFPDLTRDQTGLSQDERIVRACFRNGKPHLRLRHSSHDSFPSSSSKHLQEIRNKHLSHSLFVVLFISQTTKAFLPRMLELQTGHVVCINSILSLSPIPGTIDYCTSKASSLAFMESLTLGLLDCPGVGCTTVLPFHTNTEMFQGMRVR